MLFDGFESLAQTAGIFLRVDVWLLRHGEPAPRWSTPGQDRNVFRSGLSEDPLRARAFFGTLGVHRDEYVAVLEFALTASGFGFGDTQADEAPRDPAYGGADGGSAQGCEDRSGRDQWANPRNGQGADAGEPSEGPAGGNSGPRAGQDAPQRLGVFLAGKVLAGTFVVDER